MVSGSDEVARFHATIGGDASGLRRAAAESRAELAATARLAQQSSAATQSAFRSIAQGFGISLGFAGLTALTRGVVGLGEVMRAGVAANLSYQTAFVGVRRVVDGTDAQFQQLDSSIRRMATESLPLTRDALAGIATIGGQMGVPIGQMEQFIDTVARVSVASNGVLSPEGAAAGLGKLSSQFRVPGNEIDKLGSAVLKAADIAIGDEQQLLDILQRSAPGQRTVGFTPAQSIALGSTAMKFGNPEEVGTALGQAPMILSTLVAKGGADLAAVAAISNMSAAEFRKAWQEDAFGAFQAFTQGVNRLGEGVLGPLDELGFGGQRVGRVLLGLGGAQQEVESTARAANFELATGAHLAEESALAFGTGASQIEVFKNQMTELSGVVAGPLTTALTDVLPVLGLLIETMTTVVGGIAATPGAALTIARNIPLVGGGIGAVADVLGLANDAPKLFGGESVTDTAKKAAEIRKMRIDSAKSSSDLDAMFAGAGEDIGRGSGIATKGAEVKSPATAAQEAALARINALLESTKRPKLSDEQKALRDIEQKHTSDLVEAYIKGGDRKVAIVRAEQARLDAAWSGVAANLHDKLGVAVPEEFRLMWEGAQEEMKKGKKDSLSGLLGFLAARDTEHGQGRLTDKFSVRNPDTGEMEGGRRGAVVINGDVNFGLRPDIPGGIDGDAGFTVMQQTDFTRAGR